MIRNVIITGIGGQGVVTAAGLLRWAALGAGFAVTGSDNRGGAQRLGHVSALVRLTDESDRLLAPDVPVGGCDLLLTYEGSEGLRFARHLSRRTRVLFSPMIFIPTNQRRQQPPSAPEAGHPHEVPPRGSGAREGVPSRGMPWMARVLRGYPQEGVYPREAPRMARVLRGYPDLAACRAAYEARCDQVLMVDFFREAQTRLGDARLGNLVGVGAALAMLDLPEVGRFLEEHLEPTMREAVALGQELAG